MNPNAIVKARLDNHHLVGKGLKNAAEVVAWLGAVQSQDFFGAKWAIGQRTSKTTNIEVEKLFNEGKILRTHILRPTWHFVSPEDILWIQSLTAPRVHAASRSYYNKLGLDDNVFKKSNQLLKNALKNNNYRTREEIKQLYKESGIDASGLKLAYLVMYAELEGLVCSGSLRDKKQTLALVAERAPSAKIMNREKALAELAKRYFASHGPATLKDFGWWCSLISADLKAAVELAKLDKIELQGTTFYSTQGFKTDKPESSVRLLPNYDEYVIAYKDRSAYNSAKLDKTPTYEDLSYHFVIADGQIVGGWKREQTDKLFTIKLNMFAKLSSSQESALNTEAKRVSDFFNIPARLV